ncbi:DUF309 domain-containing protein [Pararhizobium haloflavum]|uniref:DUF309 domain-containing protein n=1 Tax=Pararhizobium haloflavum TaxID=2037914 RepID=UPI001FE12CCA|nr:DUF309 domain-containing protein [Pararhizobium haloflavum]
MPPKPLCEADAFRTAHDWPLPGEPYLPGLTARPSGADDVHRVADLAPDPTDAQAWRANAPYLAGFRLYNAGFGWEAHEVWEPVWMHARSHSAERYMVQGLIQLANARLKWTMGRTNASVRLAGIARECLLQARFASTDALVMGVDLEKLVMTLDAAGAVELPNVHYNA